MVDAACGPHPCVWVLPTAVQRGENSLRAAAAAPRPGQGMLETLWLLLSTLREKVTERG